MACWVNDRYLGGAGRIEVAMSLVDFTYDFRATSHSFSFLLSRFLSSGLGSGGEEVNVLPFCGEVVKTESLSEPPTGAEETGNGLTGAAAGTLTPPCKSPTGAAGTTGGAVGPGLCCSTS